MARRARTRCCAARPARGEGGNGDKLLDASGGRGRSAKDATVAAAHVAAAAAPTGDRMHPPAELPKMDKLPEGVLEKGNGRRRL